MLFKSSWSLAALIFDECAGFGANPQSIMLAEMDYWKRCKERTNALRNSPEFKRDSYERKVSGRIAIALLIPFGILAWFAEAIFGISGYVTCSIAGVLATTAAFLLPTGKRTRKWWIHVEKKEH